MMKDSINHEKFEFTTTLHSKDEIIPFSPIVMNKSQGEHRVVVVLIEHDSEIESKFLDENHYMNFSKVMKSPDLNLLSYAFSRIIWTK